MKVVEHLERAAAPPISFEIIPPLRGGNVKKLLALTEELARFKPPFIDITSHAAEVVYEETSQGIVQKVKRKRPGTIGVCALIQNKYGIDAVPHVLCNGFTREETEDFLIECNYLGIDNVLAIRGDDNGYRKPLKPGRSVNDSALDLVSQIAAMNRGKFLEEDLLDADPTSFCVGVAGYPEKHFEAPNLHSDIRFTRAKVEAGGEYIVSQMFFDNQHYFDYVKRCRDAGIDVPVIPGIKVLTSKRQLRTIPKTFYCDIPADLADEVEAAEDRARVIEVGIEWATRQAEGLLEGGAPSIHFYVMQNAKVVSRVMERLREHHLLPQSAG